MKQITGFVTLATILFGQLVYSQVTPPVHPLTADSSKTQKHKSHRHARHKTQMQNGMPSLFFLDLPMARDGSGTAWHPSVSPIYGIHTAFSGWHAMLHGAAYLRYTSQDIFDNGTRGGDKIDGPNWVMGMLHRPLGARTQLGLRGMFTFERLTEGGRGFPLLFQTGETYKGEPLIDTQHPHDIFAELAVTFSHMFNQEAGFFVYAALPGEPALGPPAFMHRPSARHLPGPPLAHHWQDVTHITFGVLTLGLRHQNLKFDASIFTGREPNEERFGFDRPRFDSYSFRVTANPNDNLSVQISRAFLHSPEAIAPEQDQWRTTASILYHRALNNGFWATTLIWGMNESDNFDPSQLPPPSYKTARLFHSPIGGELHSFQVESDLEIGRQAFFTRFEWVEKSPSDLGVSGSVFDDLSVATFSFGSARRLVAAGSFNLSLGAVGTLYAVPGDVKAIYGSQPFSLDVYLRLTPNQLLGHSHAMH